MEVIVGVWEVGAGAVGLRGIYIDRDVSCVFLGLFEVFDDVSQCRFVAAQIAVLLETDSDCADVLICYLFDSRNVRTGHWTALQE